ncbi:MAG: response regulator [Desulfobacterales bacterium]|nr:response regulator [Desulfobacterales bacterium]
MIKNVLVVDDDQVWLRIIKKKLNTNFKEIFNVLTAEDGLAAIEILKHNPISLVVTDLQMPRMDGFGLLAYLTEHYPDIAVIIVTAYEKPKTRKVVFNRGAAGYIAKPFDIEELAKLIKEILQKQSEGGSLHNASLEMFIQMIEMEQKTCTIRVIDKKSGKHGALFFVDGELMNARIRNLQSNEAAYEIFSWDHVTLSIENSCPIKKKVVEGDLQAILLEAMRLKDESSAGEDGFNEEGEEGDDIDEEEAERLLRNTEDKLSRQYEDKIDHHDEIIEMHPAEEQHVNEDEDEDKASIDYLWRELNKKMGEKKGLEKIYKDRLWNDFVTNVQKIGDFFECGALKACYVDKNEGNDFILIPDEETTVITANSQSSQKILQLICG